MLGAVPGNQPIEVISVRPIGAESLLVEKTLDSATGANLVGIPLSTDRPAHFAVPATTKKHNRRTGQPGSRDTERPKPAQFPLLQLSSHSVNSFSFKRIRHNRDRTQSLKALLPP